MSSAVLRLSSKYFRKLFDGRFKEGQVSRSTANPQNIPSEEEDSQALRRLFCSLHYQQDPDTAQNLIHLGENQDKHSIAAAARRLQDLATVIDYHGCHQSLDRVIDSLLNDFATPGIREEMTFTATVSVTSAAYMLASSRYFRLFTRHLVTDYTERFQDADFAEGLPDIISGLIEQSRQSWYRLKIVVNQLSLCQCTAASVLCVRGGKDRLLVDKLTDCLLPPKTALPSQREDGIALRHLLVGLYGLERMQRVAWCEQHKQQIHDTVGPDEFKRHCREIDNTDALGLCLPCTRKSGGGSAKCKCSDNDKRRLDEWVRGDSFAPRTVSSSETDNRFASAYRPMDPIGRNINLSTESWSRAKRTDGP